MEQQEQCMENGTSSSTTWKTDPTEYYDDITRIHSPPHVRSERARAEDNEDDVFENLISKSSSRSNNSSELAFLITHYLKHFDLDTTGSTVPATTATTTTTTTEASGSPSCSSSSSSWEVVGRIRELAQELAHCWEQLGSFGVRLDHPIIGSSSATSSTGSSSIYRNASYIDMALGQYPSVPPKRLQQILTASHYCTITSLQQQQQAIFDAGGSGGIGSGTNRNLLQFQQQQQADSLDGNNNAIVDFSTTNALQLPPILFASSSSLMPHNTSETTTTTSTVAIPPNPTTTMGRGRPSKQSISLRNSNNNNNTSTKHYYSYRLVIPTTTPSPSPQRQQRYLPLPVLSDPILFPKVISDIVRTYLTQKEECSNQKRVLIKLQRDLSYQQLQQPNPSTDRIHSFLTQNIQERSIQDAHLQQKLHTTKQDLFHYHRLYKDACQKYQNPFDTTNTNTTTHCSPLPYKTNILNLLPSSNNLY